MIIKQAKGCFYIVHCKCKCTLYKHHILTFSFIAKVLSYSVIQNGELFSDQVTVVQEGFDF